MTMTGDDKILDTAFDAARTPDMPPSERLMDRIMLDADSVLADMAPVATPKPAPTKGFGAILLDAIGGWPSFSGLAAATVAGVWIGVAPPDSFSNLSAGLWGETIEMPLLESDLFAGLEG